MASTTTKRGSKKPMSFGMILGITGGGFILIMIIAYMVMVPSGKQDTQVTQTRTVTQTTQLATNGQPLPNQPPGTQTGAGQFNPNADVNAYLAQSEIAQQTGQSARDVQMMNAQMQTIVGEINQGNNNVLQQLQKVQTDMVLLDQRLTNIENALNSGWKKQ